MEKNHFATYLLSTSILLAIVCTLSGQPAATNTGISLCGTACTNDRDCTGYAECFCLTDTCENRTCSCKQEQYAQRQWFDQVCIPKKQLGYECSDTSECSTLFATCAGTRTCGCPAGQELDKDHNLCSNALSCPDDPSYILSRSSNLCHKVIVGCDNCTDIQATCRENSSGNSVPLKLNDNVFLDFVNTLWRYAFLTQSADPTSEVTILLSVDHSRDTAGKTTWYWPDGEPIAYQDSVGKTRDSSSCLYLLYDGERSEMMVNDTCELDTVNIGCMIPLPPTSSVYCTGGNDSYGHYWNSTAGGVTANMPCPNTHDGEVTRECTGSGQFKQAYYDCKLKVVDEINAQLTNGSINASVALERLTSEVVTSQERLYIADLATVEETLDTAIKLLANDTLDNTTTDNFLNVVNFLIDQVNSKEWESRIGNKEKGAEGLLTTVDEFVKRLSEATNTSISIKKNNLELEVNVLTPDSNGTVAGIVFPAGSQDSDSSKTTSSLFLAAEAFTGTGMNVISSSSLLYKNLSTVVINRLTDSGEEETVDTIINSQVLSLSLFPVTPAKLKPSLKLIFVPFKEVGEGQDLQCAHWDAALIDGKGAWSPDGCQIMSANNSIVMCECEHLTNFALLMSPMKTSEKHEKILRIISLIGCCISIVSLVITIAIYGYYWRFLKSDNAMLTLALSVSLLLAYIVFLAGSDRTENQDVCTGLAVVLHFLYLTVFFLMLAEGVHMLTKVTMVFSRKSYAKQLLAAAFTIPVVIVAVSAGASQLEGYGNDNYCWLPPGEGVFWAFAGPVLAIILVNIIICGVVFQKLCSTSAMQSKETREKVRLTAWTLCVLTPLMGITWLFGIFSVSEDQQFWQYIFVVLNTLQGLGIFFFHCFLNKQVKAAMQAQKERKRTLEDFNSEMKKKKYGGASKSAECSNNSTAYAKTLTSVADGDYSTM